jgi:hypothetical protein
MDHIKYANCYLKTEVLTPTKGLNERDFPLCCSEMWSD